MKKRYSDITSQNILPLFSPHQHCVEKKKKEKKNENWKKISAFSAKTKNETKKKDPSFILSMFHALLSIL